MRVKPVDLSKVKKILVCMFKFHGDVLLITAFLSVLKKNISHAKIHCMVFSETKPMLEGHPAIDKIIGYDKKKGLIKRLGYDLGQAFRVKKEKYDLAFNMSQGDRGALFCLMSGAGIRVGFDCLGKGFFKKNSIFTHLIGKSSTHRHVVDENFDALRMLAIKPDQTEDSKLYITLCPNEEKKIQSLLEKKGLKEEKFVIIHAMSRYEHKHWPSQKWASLIEKLQKKGIDVILTGGPQKEQRRVVDEILGFLQNRAGVHNFCAKTNLKGLTSLINASRLLITIDSVPLHISSALNKPVVALFGPSIEKKWGPYRNRNSRVVAMDLECRACDLEGCGNSWTSDCMLNLPVKQVLTSVNELLECKAFS